MSTTLPSAWAKRKTQEIIRSNSIGTTWVVWNYLAETVALDTEAMTDLVAAFAKAGYEMHQPDNNWRIRKK